MEEPQYRRFFYKGRYIQSLQKGGNIVFGYETSQEEFERVKNKYPNLPYSVQGNNGKPVILIGFYTLQDIKDGDTKPTFFATIDEPVTLGGISNEELQKQILSDSTFFTNATGQPSPNTGNPNQPGPDGGDTSTPITEIQIKTAGKVIFKSKNPKRLQYPLDMKNDQDKIKFQACEFEKRDQLNTNGATFGFTFPKPKYKPIELRVVLGIQSPISDQNSVDWNSGAAGAIETALYQESLRIIKGGATQQDITNLLKKATNTAKGYETQIQQALAGQAAGLGNVLARTDNAALNPNLELLFNGPQLRPFTFQFKMSARNEDEAIEIKNIIKYFKYYMAVRETEDGLFLKAPHVFTIQYKKGESPQHPGLNLISPNSNKKACALLNCSVDYTPLGSYMTYNDATDRKKSDADGTMVAYTLSLQFQEIEPIYNTDYENTEYKVNEHPIGY